MMPPDLQRALHKTVDVEPLAGRVGQSKNFPLKSRPGICIGKRGKVRVMTLAGFAQLRNEAVQRLVQKNGKGFGLVDLLQDNVLRLLKEVKGGSLRTRKFLGG